jgi:RimJ/RimL family protein N-acetyltransferase
MPVIPELVEPLTDGHVVLRAAAERDIPEILIAYQDDPQLHIVLGQNRPPSAAELGRRSEAADADRVTGTRIHLAIVEPGSDVCRGEVNAHHFDWDHARAELGIWLAPQARGRGIAPRALRLASAWLFDACRLERVQLLTSPENEAMLRAARRAGFVQEGVLRRYAIERGARVDVVVLSRLPSDD